MPDNKKFLLRLDPSLFDTLRRWANDDLRSINAQIEYLLTDQARRAGRLPKPSNRRAPPDATDDELAGMIDDATAASRGESASR